MQIVYSLTFFRYLSTSMMQRYTFFHICNNFYKYLLSGVKKDPKHITKRIYIYVVRIIFCTNLRNHLR